MYIDKYEFLFNRPVSIFMLTRQFNQSLKRLRYSLANIVSTVPNELLSFIRITSSNKTPFGDLRG